MTLREELNELERQYHKHVPNKLPIVEAEREKAAQWKAQLNGNGQAH